VSPTSYTKKHKRATNHPYYYKPAQIFVNYIYNSSFVQAVFFSAATPGYAKSLKEISAITRVAFCGLDTIHDIQQTSTEVLKTRMWANAQPDGRPAEHRWRPLFNAAKFA